MKKRHIALLAGGWSGEREVSLHGGEAVYKALDPEKYRVSRFDPRDDLGRLIEEQRDIDLAFVLLHGRFGEDGCLQGFLELLGIPYVGSGVLASAMAMNKRVAKEAYRRAGLKVAQDRVLHRNQDFSLEGVRDDVGPSVVVKPVSEGSSLGVSVCHSREELEAGIAAAFLCDREILVERYEEGREVTCCVLGNETLETLPLVEILPNPGYAFFDYRAKYTPGATREICPAPLPEALSERIRECAKGAHRALGCRVWSRTDMIVRGEDVYVLETNTIPGMTETSLVPLAAKQAGLPLARLLDRLIDLSFGEK